MENLKIITQDAKIKNQLSDKVIIKLDYTGENGDLLSKNINISSQTFKKIEHNGFPAYSYNYYIVKTIFKKSYHIDQVEYMRIIKSIESGSRFVKIEDDIVNVGQIIVIEEKIGMKCFTCYEESKKGYIEVLDKDTLNTFERKL